MMDILIKYNNWGKKYIYKERSYNSSIIQSAWFVQAMMFKYIELLGDTTDCKMIKAKDFPKCSREKKRKKKGKPKHFNIEFHLWKIHHLWITLFFYFLHIVRFISIVYFHTYIHLLLTPNLCWGELNELKIFLYMYNIF